MTDLPAGLAITNRLTLLELDRPPNVDGFLADKAKKNPRLREPQPQLEFAIDGRPLQQVLRELPVSEPETYGFPSHWPFISVVDLAHPGHASKDLRRLLGDVPRDEEFWPLEPGRLPLYVCPVCGDLGCGAITVAVTHGPTHSTWTDIRFEDGLPYDPEPGDDALDVALTDLGPFTFSNEQYRDALTQPVSMLDELEEADRETRVAHVRQNRAPRRPWWKRPSRH